MVWKFLHKIIRILTTAVFFILGLFVLLVDYQVLYEHIHWKDELDLKLRVLVSNQYNLKTCETNIRDWVNYAVREIREAAKIHLLLTDIQPFSLLPQDSKNLDDAFLSQVSDRLIKAYRQNTEILLVFISANHSCGRTLMDQNVAFCFIEKDLQPAPWWLVEHELSHLFGAYDLILENNVMHPLLQADRQNPPTFDEHTCAIMRLAGQDLKQQAKSIFRLEDATPTIAAQMIPQCRALIPKAVFPRNIYFHLGNYYFKQNKFQEALEEYHASLKATPQIDKAPQEFQVPLEPINDNIGQCLALLGRTNDALSYLKYNTANAHNYFWLGYCHYCLSQMDEALDAYEKYTAMEVNDALGWNNLGLSYLGTVPLHEWSGATVEKAKTALQKALKLNDKLAIAHRVLGAILWEQGDQTNGSIHLNKAKELGGDISIPISKKDGSFTTLPDLETP